LTSLGAFEGGNAQVRPTRTIATYHPIVGECSSRPDNNTNSFLQPETVHVNLINAQGKTVVSQQWTAHSGIALHALSTTQLAEGLYLFKAEMGQSAVQSKNHCSKVVSFLEPGSVAGFYLALIESLYKTVPLTN